MTAAAFVLMFSASCIAAVYDWPLELSVPAPEAPRESTGTDLGTVNNLYEKTWRGRNTFEWRTNDSLRFTRQSASYDVTYDHSTKLDVSRHYLDLSGDLWTKRLAPRFGVVGLEWVPVLKLKTLNSDTVPGQFQADVDAGPAAMFSLWDQPLTVRGGLSGRTWNTEVRHGLVGTHGEDFSYRAGLFGGIEAGDPGRALGATPLFVSGRYYARTMGEHTRRVGGLATGLLAAGIATGDSLFACISDSLVHGDNSQLSEGGQGLTGFPDDPSITEHAFGARAGFRAKPRLFLEPGVTYSFWNHSKTYPWNSGILRDVRKTTEHSLQFLLNSDDGFFVEYGGGLRLDWGAEDWLFDREPDTTGEYLMNTNDCDIFRAEMAHVLTKRFKPGFGFRYTLVFSRESKTYTGNDTVDGAPYVNFYDRDEINTGHDLTLMLLTHPRCSLDVFGGIGSNLSHYIKRQKSGDNRRDRWYVAGAGARLNLWRNLRVQEIAGVRAEAGEYEFPQVHVGDPPPYSRQFYSRLNTSWQVFERVQFRFWWNQLYDDDGYWDGLQYRDSIFRDTVFSFTEVYAIQTKTLEPRASLSVVLTPVGSLNVELGAEARDVFSREYTETAPGRGEYMVTSGDEGDRLAPFVTVSDAGERVPWFVEGTIRAHVDIGDRSRLSRVVLKYWELQLAARVVF